MLRSTWHLSSPTQDRTQAPCIGCPESEPLDHQGAPREDLFDALARYCLQKPFVRAVPIQVETHKLWCLSHMSMNLSFTTYKICALGRVVR